MLTTCRTSRNQTNASQNSFSYCVWRMETSICVSRTAGPTTRAPVVPPTRRPTHLPTSVPSKEPTTLPTRTPSKTPTQIAATRGPTTKGAPMACEAVLIGSLGGNAVDIAFSPDGSHIYAALSNGKIHLRNTTLPSTNQVFYDFAQDYGVNVNLYSLAVDPDFPSRPYVFVYLSSGNTTTKISKIVKVQNFEGRGLNPMTIWTSNAPTATFDKGALRFSPVKINNEFALMFTTGYGGVSPALAQSKASHAGKVLRIRRDGTLFPEDPFPLGIFAYGVRSSQGMTFDYMTNRLWNVEFGGMCNSEINMVQRAANLAFGVKSTCSTNVKPNAKNSNNDGPKPVQPKWYMNTVPGPAQAPKISSIVICDHCNLMGGGGRIFASFTDPMDIRVYDLSSDRTKIIRGQKMLTHMSPIVALAAPMGGGIIHFADLSGNLYYLRNPMM